MKKAFGILLIIVGIVCLPSVIAPGVAETIGRLIGDVLVTFLPAYFLLRSGKKKQEEDGQEGKRPMT